MDGQKGYVEGKCFLLTCRNPSAPWKVTRPLQKVRAAVLRDRLKEVRLVNPRQPSTHVAASVADQQQQQQRPHLVLWQVPVPYEDWMTKTSRERRSKKHMNRTCVLRRTTHRRRR